MASSTLTSIDASPLVRTPAHQHDGTGLARLSALDLKREIIHKGASQVHSHQPMNRAESEPDSTLAQTRFQDPDPRTPIMKFRDC